ncbi:MAG: hypothetical protein J1F43_06575 [Muribaculaceae bacterium]|nr:hypothetical protein [Muribaculaceae bacterium]
MANFKITSATTVSELKDQFLKEFGGVLRVYDGRSEASDSIKLVSIGAKEGEFECRANRTVGSFEEDFKKEFNLKVKVYTKDNWVAVLDGITLASVKDIPKNATKASMEEFVGYKRADSSREQSDNNNTEMKNEQQPKLPNPDAIYFVLNSEPSKIEDGDEECGAEWFMGFRVIKDDSYIYGVWRYDPNELADELGVDVEDIDIYGMSYDYDSNENFPSGKDIYIPKWLYELQMSLDSNIAELCPDSDSEPINAAINACMEGNLGNDWVFDKAVPCILMDKDGEILASWTAEK